LEVGAGFGIGRGARAGSSQEPWRPFVVVAGAGVTVFKSRRSTPGSRATSSPAAAIRSTSTASKGEREAWLDTLSFPPFLTRAPAASPRRPARRRRREAPADQFQPLRQEYAMHPNNSDQVARGEGSPARCATPWRTRSDKVCRRKFAWNRRPSGYLLQETAAVRPASSRGS
jgi:hypothetical protein